ncbi:hypothetical protein BANRA_05526 [Klebsiella pneumoniae]|nr:hypothetical protein BANRA_05526 [Klebsiella pneumoniae]
MSVTRIRVKERDAIIQSLKSGVTPRIGIQHIRVGCVNEITALHQDIERIADGGASFRLIIGEYGSGKTFFLSVVRSIALEKKLVSVSADLSPDRRIHSSGGQARNLYSELMKTCPPETSRMVMRYLALLKGSLRRQGRKLTRTAPRFHQLFINAWQHYQIWSVDMTLRRSLMHSGGGMSRITKR